MRWSNPGLRSPEKIQIQWMYNFELNSIDSLPILYKYIIYFLIETHLSIDSLEELKLWISGDWFFSMFL